MGDSQRKHFINQILSPEQSAIYVLTNGTGLNFCAGQEAEHKNIENLKYVKIDFFVWETPNANILSIRFLVQNKVLFMC